MTLRLVHLSDIHFHGYGAGWDEDEDQRAELVRDLRELLGTRKADGVVVGGDTAFSGQPEEYEVAEAWLERICKASGADSTQVWVVPGNHDVDRSVLGKSQLAREFRRAIRQAADADIDQELKARLSQDPGSEGLVLCFAGYNAFADRFGCGITAQQPHWYDTTLSCDGHPVRMTGLNSVLISDSSDGVANDGSKLVLGTWQCMLPREGDPIHIAVSHHPPDWIRDWPHVEPYLRRAHVILFGHEHKFEARQVNPNGAVYVYAGAVGPERLGDDPHDEYLPSWELLSLSHQDKTLTVEVEPRVWHRRATRFGPHPDGTGRFSVMLDQPQGETVESTEELQEGSLAMAASPLASASSPATADQPEGDRRALSVRFMMLATSRRLEVGRRLGVLEEPEDFSLPQPKLYETMLTRIRDRGLIDKLRQELERG